MKQNNTIAHAKTNKNNNLKINLIPVTMKTKMNFLKTAVMAIALMGAAQVSAQTPGQFPADPTQGGTQISAPADLNVGTVDNDASFTSVTTNTVAFYKPNPTNTGSVTGATLQASITDNGTNPITFDDYLWYELSYDGTTETPNLLTGQNAQTLVLSDLPAGYHKYRVRGQVGDPSLYCPSDEYQDIIVFVLPQLDVVPSIPGGTSLTYCEDAVPSTVLSAVIDADYTGNSNDYPKPGSSGDADADFALTYQWYAVPAGGGSTISLGSNATVDLSTLTPALDPGTYTFYLDVEYANSIRDNSVAQRTYVTYGGSGSATTDSITITETPGSPTISVTGVTD